MLKCLIVDDEFISREGIHESVDWKALGIEVIGLAKNGQEGFTLFEKFLPDILITDVKMPIMDGLQLIKKIRQVHSQTKVIVISAYGEFSYAQQAMTFGVKNYLLKPIDEEELLTTLTKITEECTNEKINTEEERLIKLLKQGKMSPQLDQGIVVNIGNNVINYEQIIAQGRYRGRHLQILQFPKVESTVFLNGDNYQFCSDFITNGDLQLAYDQASLAARIATFWQISNLSWQRVLQQRQKWLKSIAIRRQTMDKLVNLYSLEKPDDFYVQINQLFLMLQQFQGLESDEIWRYLYEIVLALEKRFFLFENDQQKLGLKEQLFQVQTFQQLSETFINWLHKVYDRKLMNSEGEIIRQIKNIVHTRYQEDISSRSIAEEIYLSPNYMGKLFRERTGYYLNEYILDVRMNQAKKLLMSTTNPIADIASEVGIGSSSYFTLLFKKFYKKTPKEFRRGVF